MIELDTGDERPFLIEGGEATSLGAVSRAVLATRAQLEAAAEAGGLEDGARVLIACREPAPAVVALLAVLSSRFVGVPFHPRSPVPETLAIAGDSGARAVIGTAGELDALGDAARGLVHVEPAMPGADAGEAADPAPRRNADDDAPALLLYTSGTTGRAKGVVLTPRNLAATTELVTEHLFRLTRDDVVLLSAPLANLYGDVLVLAALRARAALSLLPGFAPTGIPAALMGDRVTFVAGVPMVGQMLLRMAQGGAPHALRRLFLGGTALGADLAEALERTLGVEVATGYGMTEGVPMAMAPDRTDASAGSVGRAAPGVELRVVDAAFEDVAPGETGEILARGDIVSPRYWDADGSDAGGLNAASHHDGWLRTGDLAHRDAEGFVFLVDRLKQILKVGGNTVYPAEVETVLRAHPAIAEAAVIGRPSDAIGEIPVAYVMRAQGQSLDAGEVMAWCGERLTPYKRPRAVEFVETMPMTLSGKVAKHKLGGREGEGT